MRLANLKAFSLIEIMLAMTIVVIAIIPLMGLIPLGLKNSHTSSEEIHAAHLLQMIAQDFKHTPVTQSKSAILNLELPPIKPAQIMILDGHGLIYPLTFI